MAVIVPDSPVLGPDGRPAVEWLSYWAGLEGRSDVVEQVDEETGEAVQVDTTALINSLSEKITAQTETISTLQTALDAIPIIRGPERVEMTSNLADFTFDHNLSSTNIFVMWEFNYTFTNPYMIDSYPADNDSWTIKLVQNRSTGILFGNFYAIDFPT